MRKKRNTKAMSTTERTWTSLTQLKRYFEKTGEEKVVEFDGIYLTTKKKVYSLYDGRLTVEFR